MCEYGDYSYTSLSDRVVVTRREHECSSCFATIPAGSRSRRWSGLTEGEFGTGYVCPACMWAERQPDHGPLHLCYGWAWDEGEGIFDRERHAYIASALARGVDPTVFGVLAEIRARLLADAGDDPEDRAAAEAWTWPHVEGVA